LPIPRAGSAAEGLREPADSALPTCPHGPPRTGRPMPTGHHVGQVAFRVRPANSGDSMIAANPGEGAHSACVERR
jgi:hypothetical protein